VFTQVARDEFKPHFVEDLPTDRENDDIGRAADSQVGVLSISG
jgi:hypothetical protein